MYTAEVLELPSIKMAALANPLNMTVSFSDVELTFGAVVCESHLQHILRAKCSCQPCEIVWDWAYKLAGDGHSFKEYQALN